jgi:phage FluMu protein Com
MDNTIKCPFCLTPVLKQVSISGYFYAKHKCRRCKRIYEIKLTPELKSANNIKVKSK